MLVVFASILFVNALISLVFAATNSSNCLIEAVSSLVAVARLSDMVSVICFNIPVIWPLWGTYPADWSFVRKDVIISLSMELMSMVTDSCLRIDDVDDCKKAPPAP